MPYGQAVYTPKAKKHYAVLLSIIPMWIVPRNVLLVCCHQWIPQKRENCMRCFSPHIILMPSAHKPIFIGVMSTLLDTGLSGYATNMSGPVKQSEIYKVWVVLRSTEAFKICDKNSGSVHCTDCMRTSQSINWGPVSKSLYGMGSECPKCMKIARGLSLNNFPQCYLCTKSHFAGVMWKSGNAEVIPPCSLDIQIVTLWSMNYSRGMLNRNRHGMPCIGWRRDEQWMHHTQ